MASFCNKCHEFKQHSLGSAALCSKHGHARSLLLKQTEMCFEGTLTFSLQHEEKDWNQDCNLCLQRCQPCCCARQVVTWGACRCVTSLRGNLCFGDARLGATRWTHGATAVKAAYTIWTISIRATCGFDTHAVWIASLTCLAHGYTSCQCPLARWDCKSRSGAGTLHIIIPSRATHLTICRSHDGRHKCEEKTRASKNRHFNRWLNSCQSERAMQLHKL